MVFCLYSVLLSKMYNVYSWGQTNVFNAFPSSWTNLKQLKTCIVYTHDYLLPVFFYPAFAGTMLPPVDQLTTGKPQVGTCTISVLTHASEWKTQNETHSLNLQCGNSVSPLWGWELLQETVNECLCPMMLPWCSLLPLQLWQTLLCWLMQNASLLKLQHGKVARNAMVCCETRHLPGSDKLNQNCVNLFLKGLHAVDVDLNGEVAHSCFK